MAPASARSHSEPKTSGRAGLAVALDELERPVPRVRGRLCELLLLAVKEAVRGSPVRADPVVDARVGQRLVDLRVALLGDVLVGAALEGEDRGLHLRCALARARRI